MKHHLLSYDRIVTIDTERWGRVTTDRYVALIHAALDPKVRGKFDTLPLGLVGLDGRGNAKTQEDIVDASGASRAIERLLGDAERLHDNGEPVTDLGITIGLSTGRTHHNVALYSSPFDGLIVLNADFRPVGLTMLARPHEGTKVVAQGAAYTDKWLALTNAKTGFAGVVMQAMPDTARRAVERVRAAAFLEGAGS